jgi:hypothetical protein
MSVLVPGVLIAVLFAESGISGGNVTSSVAYGKPETTKSKTIDHLK